MKSYSLIAVIISTLFLGCSTKYVISSFPSKKEFYNNFNKFAINKPVNVVLNNDSTFNIDNGAQVINDSLCYVGETPVIKFTKSALSEIKELSYTDNTYKSATILLKDGKKYNALQTKIFADSIEYGYINRVVIKKDIIPITKVKGISYTSRILGIIPGSITGFGSGFIVGFAGSLAINAKGKKQSDNSRGSNFLPVSIGSGVLLGIITGLVVGNNYVYIFTEQQAK